jgi:hypothetical protein
MDSSKLIANGQEQDKYKTIIAAGTPVLKGRLGFAFWSGEKNRRNIRKRRAKKDIINGGK